MKGTDGGKANRSLGEHSSIKRKSSGVEGEARVGCREKFRIGGGGGKGRGERSGGEYMSYRRGV